MLSLEEEMKKIFLAGIGAAATTFEKAQDMVSKLVNKGELTVEQGRVLNEELKHNFTDKNKASVMPEGKPDLLSQIDFMSAEDIAKLKAKLASVEQNSETK